MIDRYTRPAMGRIWTEENKYSCWLRVESAASTVLAEEEKLGGLAVSLGVVAEEPEKLAVAAQVAVIVFAPVTRPDPLHSQSALHR